MRFMLISGQAKESFIYVSYFISVCHIRHVIPEGNYSGVAKCSLECVVIYGKTGVVNIASQD